MDTRIDATAPTADRPGDAPPTATPIRADGAPDHQAKSRIFVVDSEETGDELDGSVAAVTTIAHSR